jgi:hypothetical protein
MGSPGSPTSASACSRDDGPRMTAGVRTLVAAQATHGLPASVTDDGTRSCLFRRRLGP